MGICNAKPCLAYGIRFNGKKGSYKERNSKKTKKSIRKRDSKSADSSIDSSAVKSLRKSGNVPTNEEDNFLYAEKMFSTGRLISLCDLYNLLNDGGHRPYIQDPMHIIVIDARDVTNFEVSHIITAKQHDKVMGCIHFTGSLSKYAVVVLYGAKLSNEQSCQHLKKIMQTIEEYGVCDILVLHNGFSMFKDKYPYLCTDREVESISDRKLLLSYPSVIIDDILYQGRGDQATNKYIVDILGITHIVNISEHKNAFPQKIKYLKLPLEDLISTNLFLHFEKTSAFIHDALSKGGRVLVHCNLGVSRSSTITLAYLMKHKAWNLGDSLSYLRSKRICVCPNAGFLVQLSDLEYELKGERCTDVSTVLR